MPIDTSIYNNLLRPPKTVQEYDNEAMQGQQNRLALQLEQNKASEFQRNIAGENKLSQLLAAGGDPAAVTNGLASAGYGSKALAYTKAQQDLKKGAADVGHLDAQTGKLKQETTGLDYDQREKKRTKAITDIAAFTTPQEAMASLKAHADAGDIAPEQAQMIAQGIPQNPADFPKWQIGMLQRIMSAKDAMGQLAPDANAKLTAQTSTDNNAATNDTSRANNAATVGATIRGQNMTDRRAADANQNSRGVIIQTDTGPMLANTRTGATQQIIGPDGKPVTRTKPLTEFQGKSAAFGDRAMAADKILVELGANYSPAAINSKNSVEGVPLVGGAMGAITNKFALSENDQKAEQAQRDFINAVLRQESGAAIGANEFDNARKQYFPQPGDKSNVIAQKAANRKLVIEGFKRSAGANAEFTPVAPVASTLPTGWSVEVH